MGIYGPLRRFFRPALNIPFVGTLYRSNIRPLTRGFYKTAIRPKVSKVFLEDLVEQTDDFSATTWLGKPIWQNTLDLWVIQETIWEIQPELLIECGTNRGGSAFFYAQLFDLIGKGKIVTIDIAKMHDLTHPRIEFIIGDSSSEAVLDKVRQAASLANGPVMVILDSDHSAAHVSKELELYSPFVSSVAMCWCKMESSMFMIDGGTSNRGLWQLLRTS